MPSLNCSRISISTRYMPSPTVVDTCHHQLQQNQHQYQIHAITNQEFTSSIVITARKTHFFLSISENGNVYLVFERTYLLKKKQNIEQNQNQLMNTAKLFNWVFNAHSVSIEIGQINSYTNNLLKKFLNTKNNLRNKMPMITALTVI